MVEILKKHYWSKADAFILPLTGLPSTVKFDIRSYLFWDDYNIENYNLILKFRYDNYEEFVDYCNKEIFPILNKKGYLLENYDCDENLSIFILDISEWAMDIEMFLKGKYSKFSKEAKSLIEGFHNQYSKGILRMPIHIFACLYPNDKLAEEPKKLDNLTILEYVAKNYEFDLTDLRKTGELGTIYDIESETLTLECNSVMTEQVI